MSYNDVTMTKIDPAILYSRSRGVMMDLDINIEAHDLLWRLKGPAVKKRCTESFGARKSELVESEVAKPIKSGLVLEKDNQYELTPKGKTL
jgi:hypothetical protein